MRTPEDIIPSQQIVKVHGHANFGPHRAMRDVVNEAVLKVACGYSNGSTANDIIREHGLVSGINRTTLSEKGRKYLWAVFGEGSP